MTDDRCTDCGGYLWAVGAELDPYAPGGIRVDSEMLVCPTCDRPRCAVCKRPFGALLPAPGAEINGALPSRCDDCQPALSPKER